MGITYGEGAASCEKCGSDDTYDLKGDDGSAVRSCGRCLHLKVLSGPG